MADFSDTDEEALLQVSEELEKQGKLCVPRAFAFPFPPYEIQTRFMSSLYTALELGKIGIFESPTGTGKSLSLICGGLTWLLEHERKQAEQVKNALEAAASSAKSRDWIENYALARKIEQSIEHVQAEVKQRLKTEQRLAAVRASLDVHRRTKMPGRRASRSSRSESVNMSDRLSALPGNVTEKDRNGEIIGGDSEELLDYDSGDELGKSRMRSEEEDEEEDTEKMLSDEVPVTKIFFCSRTHSQLAQFVREVYKSPFGREVKLASLGSRQTMCTNDSVRQLPSLSQINDRCTELRKCCSSKNDRSSNLASHDVNLAGETAAKKRKTKKKTIDRCPYYRQEAISDLSDRMLADVQDIEDLVALGQDMKACPYYAARRGVAAAQLVVMPYNMLLHKSTRDSLSISLKGHVVIIDEAHNLLDAISSMHRSGVSCSQLRLTQSQLQEYVNRFRSRLNAKNLAYVELLLTIVIRLIKYIEKRGTGSTIALVNDFLFESGLDGINFFKVLNFCNVSRIADKLLGYGKLAQQQRPQAVVTQEAIETVASGGLSALLGSLEATGRREGSTDTACIVANRTTASFSSGDAGKETFGEQRAEEESAGCGAVRANDDAEYLPSSPLRSIVNLLRVLTNADSDGRVVVTCTDRPASSTLQYLLLNPALYFADVLKEARAVIVAGGTMQPVSDFKEHLFLACNSVRPERIMEFSCGHIVPPENLLAIALAPTTNDGPLEITYHKRGLDSTLDCIGKALLDICLASPGGVVCFLPSYDYEAIFYRRLDQSGLLSRLAAVKKVFREPKKSSMVDETLAEYAASIAAADLSWPPSGQCITGSLLLSVVGGKMSEGINFSDDLGRCVVMVGLPYPNAQSAELKEKMKYLDAKASNHFTQKSAGNMYYENLCMKAVNQSIGRAIRHKNDYAVIVLLDCRYQKDNIVKQLPGWVSERVCKEMTISSATASIRQFFTKKKTASCSSASRSISHVLRKDEPTRI